MVRDRFLERHPAVQFCYFALVICITIFVSHPLMAGISFLGALCYNIQLLGGKKTMRFQVCYMFPMTCFVVAVNGAFSHYGVTPLYYMKTGAVTLETLVYGCVLAGILLTSLLWFSCVNEILTMDKLVFLLGRLTPALSLSLSLVFRFVSRCKEQFRKIRQAGEGLGEPPKEGKWFPGIRRGAGELSMLLTWALENGVETADSMRARGYGSGKRTAYGLYHMTAADGRNLALQLLLSILVVAGILRGYAASSYNPVIKVQQPELTPGWLITYGSWFVLCFLPVLSHRKIHSQ